LARRPILRLGGKAYPTPHPFVEEVESLVLMNYNLLRDTISRHADEEIAKVETDDPATLGSEIQYWQSVADDLRKDAVHFALVSLVTRFQHSVKELVREVTKSNVKDRVIGNLKILNHRVGPGPVETSFFKGLVTVRNSIIHADSKAEWMSGKELRYVPDCYRAADSEWINFTEVHLTEAVEKSLAQINWYDNRLDDLIGLKDG
jgi:hypothetical protein